MTRREIQEALAEPFPPEHVQWKPGVVNGNRTLAIAYIDARQVMDRLDEVVGLGNWQTAYTETAGGVICRLTVMVEGSWVVHEDVGARSEQKDQGDRLKAAFSDALKRAAIHFGVGRYLYELPAQWVDFDPQKKRIVGAPRLPDWAIPKRRPARPAQPAPVQHPPAQSAPAQVKKPDPETAADLEKWLSEAELASGGVFRPGELHPWVINAMRQANASTPLNLLSWAPALVKTAVGLVKQRYLERRCELGAIREARARVEALLDDVGATWEQVKEHHRGTGPADSWSLADWEDTLKRLKEVFEDVEVF